VVEVHRHPSGSGYLRRGTRGAGERIGLVIGGVSVEVEVAALLP